jgi:hypothetical protein
LFCAELTPAHIRVFAYDGLAAVLLKDKLFAYLTGDILKDEIFTCCHKMEFIVCQAATRS